MSAEKFNTRGFRVIYDVSSSDSEDDEKISYSTQKIRKKVTFNDSTQVHVLDDVDENRTNYFLRECVYKRCRKNINFSLTGITIRVSYTTSNRFCIIRRRFHMYK